MMSLYDEYDMLDSGANLSSNRSKDANVVCDSLANELGDALGDESYESDTVNAHRQAESAVTSPNTLQSPDFDYTGEDWGDPAEDSDPDGRFASLNDTIYAFYETMHVDPDSAYMSDDMSEKSGNMPILKEDFPSAPLVELDQFIDKLRAFSSQSEVEQSSLRLISANKFVTDVLAKHRPEIRELTQAYTHGSVKLTDKDLESGDVTDCLKQLEATLPGKATLGAATELLLLEAETNALVADLCLLKDSLQEFKQLAYQAQRALKSTRESCSQWMNEAASVEESQRWLTEHDMGSKLSDRAFSKELVIIKSGFEDVCNRLRRQISEKRNEGS